MVKVIKNKVQGNVNNCNFDYQLVKDKNAEYKAECVSIYSNDDRYRFKTRAISIPLGKENPEETFKKMVKKVKEEFAEKIENLRGDGKDIVVKLDVQDGELTGEIKENRRRKEIKYKGFEFSVSLRINNGKKHYIHITLQDYPPSYRRRDVTNHIEEMITIKNKNLKLTSKPPFITQESNIDKAHKRFNELDEEVKSKVDDYINQYE